MPSALDIEPAAQGVHSVELSDAEIVPARHREQTLLLLATELPAGQAVQFELPKREVDPLGQVVQLVAFTFENEPAGHEVHSVELSDPEKVPAGH